MIANHHKYSGVLIAALLLFAGGHSDAASWRINNNTNRHAHFASINAAMDSNDVQDGDTLYLDPGCTLTANQTVSKRVTIIGTGYYLDSGTHEVGAINATLYLKAAGIKMEGVAVTTTSYKTWYVQADNVTIERCLTNYIYIQGQHAVIRQCRGFHYYGKGKDSMDSAYCIIENCLLGTSSAVNVYDLCNATICNNYLWTRSNNTNGLLNNLKGCVIKNNIIIGSQKPDVMFNAANLTECIVTNNVMSCAEGVYPAYPDNICLGSNSSSEVFLKKLDESTYDDKEFVALKDVELVKGVADDGGDCGPFGGTHPYVPSGYPFGMPRFVTSSSGFRATDGKVSFSNQVTIQKQ